MPTKLPSPLLGYNNNVRHKGKVFHVQTEDSGVKYGHIITHLFMDGGRILKSVKTSYSEYVDNDRMGEIVREMMKQQHKAMFIALRDGKFDSIIEGAGEAAPPPASSTQAFLAAPAAPPSSTAVDAPCTPGPAKVVPVQPPARASGLTPAPSVARVSPATEAEAAPREEAELSRVTEGSGPRVAEELGVDIEAVERAAAAATGGASAMRASVDLPPPPPNLFREKTAAGKYRVSSPPAAAQTAGARPATGRHPSSSPVPGTVRTANAERRYAPTRPASIFGQARPQQGKSIFGEDLISDKSLDEVILSYLAEDLEGEKK